jgi:uncharacterized membrane protein YbhN (UPF0104 family)
VTRWRRLGASALRWLPLVFLVLVGWLLWRQARTWDWREVRSALAGLDAATIATCVGLAVLSFALYAGYELLARRYIGHRLSRARTALIAIMSYAFNLNIGTLVGGAGFRFRLYSRSGLKPAVIARLVAFCIVTNWVGYVLLAGALFAFGSLPIPDELHLGRTGLRALGFALLAAALGYLAACALVRKRELGLKWFVLELPTLRVALVQFALSLPNWLALATIMWLLLGQEVPYALVLGALLLGAIAGALAHVPGALGVLEAVYLAVLGGSVSTAKIAAALIAYRVIYYLLPLLVALVLYARFEWRARRDAPARGARAVTSSA